MPSQQRWDFHSFSSQFQWHTRSFAGLAACLFDVPGLENSSIRGHASLPHDVPEKILNEADTRRRSGNKSSKSENGSLCPGVVSSVCAPRGRVTHHPNAGTDHRAERNRLCRKWLGCPVERTYPQSCLRSRAIQEAATISSRISFRRFSLPPCIGSQRLTHRI